MITCHSLISRTAPLPAPVAMLPLSTVPGGEEVLRAGGFHSHVLSRVHFIFSTFGGVHVPSSGLPLPSTLAVGYIASAAELI